MDNNYYDPADLRKFGKDLRMGARIGREIL